MSKREQEVMRSEAIRKLFRDDLGHLEGFSIYQRMLSVSRQLSNIAERVCSVKMTEQQEKWNNTRERHLIAEGYYLCKRAGGFFYHQTDPRGVSFYFIPLKALLESCKRAGVDAPNNQAEVHRYIDSRYTQLGYPIY